MTHVLIHHKVKSFAAWKPVFDQNAPMRAAAGCKGGTLLHSTNNPNEITILFDWDNIDNAQRFAESDKLKEAMQKAGVLGKPEVRILDQVGRFD